MKRPKRMRCFYTHTYCTTHTGLLSSSVYTETAFKHANKYNEDVANVKPATKF